MAATVTIMCPNLTCRSVLRVPDKVRGKIVRCGECGMTFTVPQRQEPPTASPPPEPVTTEEKK